MQTFLPFPQFNKSASCLDNKRLGKQRVEAKQILQALIQGPTCIYDKNGQPGFKYKRGNHQLTDGLTYRKTPWYNHPAVRMWNGYEAALAEYGLAICEEWISRGFNDTCKRFFKDFLAHCDICYEPIWLGNNKFHTSHQSNLLRKNKEYYSTYFNVPDNLPYFWPITNEKNK